MKKGAQIWKRRLLCCFRGSVIIQTNHCYITVKSWQENGDMKSYICNGKLKEKGTGETYYGIQERLFMGRRDSSQSV